jgi:MATE family multidrug resistance protein
MTDVSATQPPTGAQEHGVLEQGVPEHGVPENGAAAPSYGEILRFALPLMLGMVTFALLTAIDGVFLGRLGTTPLAALGIASVYYFAFLVLFMGLMRNSIAFVGRAWGARQPERIGPIVAQYQWLAMLGFPVVFAVVLAFPWVASVGGIEPAVAQAAFGYLRIRVWDIPFALTVILYSSLYQSLGNSTYPMLVQWGVVALNVLLAYLLIFGHAGFPALGMPGAALATVIAQVTGTAVIVATAQLGPLRRKCGLKLLGRPVPGLLREVVIIGVPQGLGDFVEISAYLGFFLIIGRMGESSLAANNIGMAATHFLFMPGFALGIACASYMGRLIGAGRPDHAALAVRRALGLGIVYMTVLGVGLWFWGESIARLFTADESVIALTGYVFKVMAFYQAFDALGIIVRSALGGAGDTLVPAALLAALALTVLYPAAWMLSRTIEPGVAGAWMGAAIFIAVLGIALYTRFQLGAWRRIRIAVGA